MNRFAWAIEDWEELDYDSVSKGESAGHPFRGNQWTKVNSATKLNGTKNALVQMASNFDNFESFSRAISLHGMRPKVWHIAGENFSLDQNFKPTNREGGNTEESVLFTTTDPKQWSDYASSRTMVVEYDISKIPFSHKSGNNASPDRSGNEGIIIPASQYANLKELRRVSVKDALASAKKQDKEMPQSKEEALELWNMAKVSKGDYHGHPFRGNQWTGGKPTVAIKPFSPQKLPTSGLNFGASGLGDSEPYPSGALLSEEQVKAVEFVSAGWIGNNRLKEYRENATKIIEDGVIDLVASEGNRAYGLDSELLARTLTAIRDAPTSTVWRGLQVSEEVAKGLKVGAIHEEALATATGRKTLAFRFSKGVYSDTQGSVSVVLKIEGKNVPIGSKTTRSDTVKFADERFISGKYKITKRTWDKELEAWVIEMRQQ